MAKRARSLAYASSGAWRSAERKRVMLFGMSGLGKTHVSNILRRSGDWFHYSVDYRIGTRYMGEFIVDNFKKEAMRNPFLAELLRSDSIYIASNIQFENLEPLSTYIGKPGAPAKGGIPFEEYRRRQAQHRFAEINAMRDTTYFAERARELYGYDCFVCDSSGSLIEVVDPDNEDDPVLARICSTILPVWIKGTDRHIDELVERFSRDPKPMYYKPEFLSELWEEFLAQTDSAPETADPDAFIRWGYRRLLDDRAPRYAALAGNWGVTIRAHDINAVSEASEFVDLVADAIDARDGNCNDG